MRISDWSSDVCSSDLWLPWAPLAIADEPNLLTRFKLARLHGDGEACRAVLRSAAIPFEPVPDRDTGAGCGFENAVRAGSGLTGSGLTGAGLTIAGSVVATCPLIVAWALFERHALQPAAAQIGRATVCTP